MFGIRGSPEDFSKFLPLLSSTMRNDKVKQWNKVSAKDRVSGASHTAFPCAIKTYTQPVLSHQACKEKGPGMSKRKCMSFHFLINFKFEVGNKYYFLHHYIGL